MRNSLSGELLDIALLAQKSKRNDTTDVHLRTVDVHVKTQFLTNGLDVTKTLLVVRTSTTDPDLDLVLVQNRGDLTQGTDDTLEGRSNVGEVGNTTTNEKNLAVGVGRSTQHQVEDGVSVVVGLSLGGSTGVLTVVGELTDEASGGNGIGVHDGGTTTSNQGPDTALGVEDGELERGTGLSIQLSDELLLLAHLTAERSGELHWWASVNVDLALLRSDSNTKVGGATGNSPLGAALELSGLVQLGSQIQEVDLSGGGISVGDDNERVDLEVGELAVDVDGVQTRDEVHEDVVNTAGHLLQESGSDLLIRGVVLQVDRNKKLLGLGVNITNIDTSLVGKEDPVTLPNVSRYPLRLPLDIQCFLPHARSGC